MTQGYRMPRCHPDNSAATCNHHSQLPTEYCEGQAKRTKSITRRLAAPQIGWRSRCHRRAAENGPHSRKLQMKIDRAKTSSRTSCLCTQLNAFLNQSLGGTHLSDEIDTNLSLRGLSLPCHLKRQFPTAVAPIDRMLYLQMYAKGAFLQATENIAQRNGTYLFIVFSQSKQVGRGILRSYFFNFFKGINIF